ncbi:hypothetical protein Hanom_Chr07g00595091 [Helianthus anomalus]
MWYFGGCDRILAMGGLSHFYLIRPKAFHEEREMSLRSLLQTDCKGISFMVEDVVNPEICGVLGGNAPDVGGSAVGVIEGTPSSKEGSYKGSENSQHSPRVENGNSTDEYLATRISRKPKPDLVVDVKVVIPEPRSILKRFRSACPQKSQPASRSASEAPLVNTKGSLSKHLKILRPSTSLGSSKAPNVISTAHASSQAKEKGLERSATPIDPIVGASPVQATGQSRFKLLECFHARTPLAPSMVEGLPATYIPRWKITHSIVVGTPEIPRDFMAHALPPSHRFMNSALDLKIFDDQYCLSICEGIFRGAGMLQRVNAFKDKNEGLLSLGAELWMLKRSCWRGRYMEKTWEREQVGWLAERERLASDVKHYKDAAFVSAANVDLLYADLGIAQEDRVQRHLERIYRAYRDVGYQAGLKDGYSYTSQGLQRKETPNYISKVKKDLAKLDE